MNILLVAALLPAIALMMYVYRKDQVEREPAGLVARVFLIGAASGLVAGAIEGILFDVFEAVIPAGVFLIVVEYFVGVAAVEEGCKYFALNTIRKSPEFNYVFDAVVYSVAAALGFAALENVFYVFDGGLEVAFTRAIFSVPGHMADGVVMGVFFGLARQRELRGNVAGARAYYLLAWLLPVIEHGFYDAALSLDSDLMALAAMVTDLAFIAVAFALIRSVSRNDAPLHPPTAASRPTSAAQFAQPQQSQPQQWQLQQPQPWQQAQQPQSQQQPWQQAQQPQSWQQPQPQQPWQQAQQPQQQPWRQDQVRQAWDQDRAQRQAGDAPEPPVRRAGGPTVRYSSQNRK